MDPTRRAMLGMTAVTIGLAGCTGGDGGGDGSAGSSPTSTGATPTTGGVTTTASRTTADGGGLAGAAVEVAEHPELGEILVDGEGSTLYMFDSDERDAGESTCYDDCAGAWPPLTVDGSPEAGESVTAELATFEREDGSTQVAAGGWPLYYWQGDDEPGDATGQGVNDVWWVLDRSGEPIEET